MRRKSNPRTFFYFIIAIASISTNASFGNLATSTQLLAGAFSLKYSPYTSLTSPKSFIFLIYTTVFTTFSNEVPAASKIAFIFSKDCFVAAFISVTSSPVEGFNGIWPDVNNKSPTFCACEYGPIALGAFSVKITSLIHFIILLVSIRISL